jgi:dCMP deaminase
MKTDESLGSYESKSETRRRKYDVAYMDIAKRWALLSLCDKKQVGAIIVKERMIISDGFNGTPTGFNNTCEDRDGKTHWYTLHAEANAILKLAASTQNSIGATLYITCSPCRDCAKLIYQSGIKKVVYGDDYKTSDGVDFLKQAGIIVQKITDIQNNFTDIIDSFYTEEKTDRPLFIYKTISKALGEKDYDSIEKAADFLLENYGENISLIRAYLLATNSFKEELEKRNNVYVKAIQICDKSRLNTNDFLHNLK